LTVLLFTGILGCENATDDLPGNDMPWDISPDSIEKEIDGIAFKFCLLNEQGKPATVFNEGENFSFYFSVTNCSKKDFYFDAYLLAYDKNFLRIYSSSNYNFGKSYKPLFHTDIGIAAYPFNDGDSYIFNVPWMHEKEANFKGEDFEYQSIITKSLGKGNYFTGFKYSFYFQGHQYENTIKTDSINFKINFKIQ